MLHCSIIITTTTIIIIIIIIMIIIVFIIMIIIIIIIITTTKNRTKAPVRDGTVRPRVVLLDRGGRLLVRGHVFAYVRRALLLGRV